MEFPGGSITNIRVIDGFSNIYWRIYTEEASASNPPSDGANNGPTILKHISRLKELELRLRSLGCLVLSYPRRLGLLIFSATPDFQHLSPTLLNEGGDESNRLLVGSTVLKVWTFGNVSSGDLVKSLRSDLQTTSANSPAASQRAQSGSVPPRRVDNSGGSAAIYASFISAVTAALSLQIVRQNGAIPLGPRTLFNSVESTPEEDYGLINGGPTSISALTSLQIQLTSVGKLTVALQTIAQCGLTRLSQPGADPSELSHLPPGTDIWLAPAGSIARLVARYSGGNNPTPCISRLEGVDDDRARIKRWESVTLEWLSYFGLPIDSITEDGWVEVEVWEPFYAKLSGAVARTKEENSPLPLKRILWPSIYCFRRAKSTVSEVTERKEEPLPFDCDPLGFAENWCFKEIPQSPEVNVKPGFQQEEQQTKVHGALSPGSNNFLEGIESLSRASLYPDLQAASLVYPTPPDGTTGVGVNPVFAEDSDHGSALVRDQAKNYEAHSSTKGRSDTDVTMGFGPSAGLAVGSGLYDTNGDDDLFGDMDETDFGTKGITDEDFNFFDDPDFDPTGNRANVTDMQPSPDLVDAEKLKTDEFLEPKVPFSHDVVVDAEHALRSGREELPKSPLNPHISDNNALILLPRQDQIQPVSPPLSPVEVKKILLPDSIISARPVRKSAYTPSYYNPVAFKDNLSTWDKKYGADGKFSFASAGTVLAGDSHTSGGIPTIGLPRRRGMVKTLPYTTAPDYHESHQNETALELSSSVDSSSGSDEESDSSGLGKGMPTITLATLKRKRTGSSMGSSPASDSEKAPVGTDQEVTLPKSDDSVFLGNFLSTFSDWSITGFFSMAENQVLPTLTPWEVQVQIAQLLVDQVTQSSFDHKIDEKFRVSFLDNQAFCLRDLFEGTEVLGGFEKLDLQSFVTLQEQNDFSPAPMNGPTPRQNLPRKEAGKGSITKLSPPHLRVRRGKDFLETLPPAVLFWETFGLEPAHGPKDIIAYCIHPPGSADAADTFLTRLSQMYSSCNLGSHVRGDDTKTFIKGLRGWDIIPSKQPSYHTSMQQLRALCEELGAALLNAPSSKDNYVVYIINPFPNAASLVDICAAFWYLLQKYVAVADKHQSNQLNEVILQIIPLDFVTSAEWLVVPPQEEYLNLALEVYSRCPPRQVQGSLVNCAPPIVLAEPLPPSIGFKLASQRSSPLQEGKCIHVACSRSQDQRWMSVAWSDNSGVLQRTMSYCLRFRNSAVSRSLSAVRTEIWSATKDILEKHQARWKVIIVSTENVDQDEYDTWLKLAEQHNKSSPVPVELTMLNVNTTSDLFLSPPPSPLPMSILNPQASTPVATPVPSGAILSPDQLGNAPTPPSGANIPATPTDALFESDPESLLTDICDESWGLVLSHRLNSTLHLTEYRPALASGYLLRRRGLTDADGAFTMSVNLLYTQRSSSSYETLLRDIIGMYRDLATLARARGTRIVQCNTLPWHIATAVRAQELLSYVL
ncbi:mediator complex subunit 13 C-terminal-domain-containing protein [Aspergillus egyptiacus]|nr:mediator complex subunit 13 C-terminal-domain-containing protein [Aspergillus egyptiacus]